GVAIRLDEIPKAPRVAQQLRPVGREKLLYSPRDAYEEAQVHVPVVLAGRVAGDPATAQRIPNRLGQSDRRAHLAQQCIDVLDLLRASRIALTQELEANHLRRQLNRRVTKTADLPDQLWNEMPLGVIRRLDHAKQRLQIRRTVDRAIRSQQRTIADQTVGLVAVGQLIHSLLEPI